MPVAYRAGPRRHSNRETWWAGFEPARAPSGGIAMQTSVAIMMRVINAAVVVVIIPIVILVPVIPISVPAAIFVYYTDATA